MIGFNSSLIETKLRWAENKSKQINPVYYGYWLTKEDNLPIIYCIKYELFSMTNITGNKIK